MIRFIYSAFARNPFVRIIYVRNTYQCYRVLLRFQRSDRCVDRTACNRSHDRAADFGQQFFVRDFQGNLPIVQQRVYSVTVGVIFQTQICYGGSGCSDLRTDPDQVDVLAVSRDRSRVGKELGFKQITVFRLILNVHHTKTCLRRVEYIIDCKLRADRLPRRVSISLVNHIVAGIINLGRRICRLRGLPVCHRRHRAQHDNHQRRYDEHSYPLPNASSVSHPIIFLSSGKKSPANNLHPGSLHPKRA